MSERFYTTIKVSGPNADAAAISAMEAILNQPEDENGWDPYHGGWCDDDPYGPCYFDHISGQGAVVIVTEVARNFPEARFHLCVNGSYGEGFQGPVRIQNGNVTDGRNDFISYGGPYDDPEYVEIMKPFKEPVPADAVTLRMSPEQRERHRLLYGGGGSLLVTSHEPETPEDVEASKLLDEAYRTLKQGQ